LKPLTIADEELLCGRESVVAEVVANCRAERHAVVSSQPGVGVSPLFAAGLVPALQRAGYIVVLYREWEGKSLGSDFLDAIAHAVRDQADPQFVAQGEPLDQVLSYIRERTGRTVALVLDQFEDYIRCQTNSHESDVFDADLGRVIAQRKGCCVMGLQAHALPGFERLTQHVPNLLGYHIRLQSLTAEAGAEMVRRVTGSRGMEAEPAAMAELLQATVVARPEGTVHPFFLRIALDRLCESEYRAKSNVLRLITIETFGGVDRVVLESLDYIIKELSGTQQDLLFRWFRILVSPDDARLSVTEKGLAEYAGRLNRFALSLLPTLVEKEILRIVHTKDTDRYEVAREGLTPILRDWWERREAILIARRRARFRVTSISVAVGAILLVYIVWLIIGMK